MPTLGAWDTVVTDTWDNQTEKWDILNFTMTGTLQAEVSLNSLKEMGLAYAGNLSADITLNSPPEFPIIDMSGTLSMKFTLASKFDYAIWVKEASRSRNWTEEAAG
jgi:hypothetical protein